MTEISHPSPTLALQHSNHLDLLFEIYMLRKVRKRLTSKLKSFEKLLKSGKTLEFSYNFEALKAIITENSTQLKNLLAKIDNDYNLFDLTKNLKRCELYIQNLKKERKKKNIDLETFELTKGHYLQQILDTQDRLKQLKIRATDYYQELRSELIEFEDQKIRLSTEKLRKNINKEDFKEKSQEFEYLKRIVEDKLAFLKVRILDYEFEVIE